MSLPRAGSGSQSQTVSPLAWKESTGWVVGTGPLMTGIFASSGSTQTSSPRMPKYAAG
ncbi:hypothetical protein J2Z21_000954 [Streptomyces griseochromogenes]|uniref:Uncharacterized protein n=1 Tax=Streptomyces griseochromogenes TaxID=68214 RepID=A0ABS4LKW0_9ACTN|nr:hypothetical protein [Streptomyces griseochromogenes]